MSGDTINKGSMEDKSEFAIVKLGFEPYVSWKKHMTNVLQAKGLWPLSTVVTDQKKESLTQALITSSLDKTNRMNVIDCATSTEIWARLEKLHEVKTTFEVQNLFLKLNNYRIQSGNKISEGIAEMRYIVAKLKTLNEQVTDNNLMSIILRALPKGLKHVQSSWKTFSTDDRNLDNLISYILSEAADANDKYDDVAYLARNNGKPSYQAKNNWNKRTFQKNSNYRNEGNSGNVKQSYNKDSNKKEVNCYYCGKKGHYSRDCRKQERDKKEKGISGSSKPQEKQSKSWALMARGPVNTIKTEWVVDSGCSMHMTPRLELMTAFKYLEDDVPIGLGDDSIVNAIGIGTIETTLGTMNNVYYVPDLNHNLYSIKSAMENGLQVTFDKNSDLTFRYNQEEVLRGYFEHGLFMICLHVIPHKRLYKAAPLDVWHQRLGHVSIETIRKMVREKAVDGLDIGNAGEEVCAECALGKCTKSTHRDRTSQRATEAGRSLHFDTAGPVKQESLHGSKYFLLCKDEYSAYRIVRFIEFKSEIANEVKQIISQTNFETGNKVLRIVTDNGSEFRNENLLNFLKEHGINHVLSAPYTPEQNGLIERDIRTIVESSRTLLEKSRLPMTLWAESTNTAVYTLNRVLSKYADQTPYELWFGRKPNVQNMHQFGSKAIILDNAKKGKFDSRGKRVIFVGYTDNYNTYRFLDFRTMEIIVTSNVRFLDATERVVPTITEVEEPIEIPTVSATANGNEQVDDTQCDGINDLIFNETDGYIDDTPNLEPMSSSGLENRTFSLEELNEESISAIGPIRSERVPIHNRMRYRVPNGINLRARPVMAKRFQATHKGRHHAMVAVIDKDPETFEEAMSRSDRNEWVKAMLDEIESLKKNKVWTLVDRPKANIVTNRWVLKIKRKPNGEIDRYKARLVARGFSQRYGLDYHETYAPVANMISIRLLFAYAAVERLHIAQFDVKTAFLYGDLDETVYMEQPEGFIESKGKVCLLQRSLYGLKQAPRQWNKKFTAFLKQLNLTVSENDHCIFFCRDPLLIIAIYVDDGIIMSRDAALTKRVIVQLKTEFDIHSVESNAYLGFQYHRGPDGEVAINQTSYCNKILERFNMQECNTVNMPITVANGEMDDTKLDDDIPYREAIGSLMYASVISRIDLAFAVNKASRKVADPSEMDWKNVKRIFRYLKGKEDYGLIYSNSKNEGLIVYCDADFAGDQDSHKSTTGSVFIYGGAPIHWKSQRQNHITLSSTEAEIVSICSTVKEIIWIRRFGQELGILSDEPTRLYCDNTSAIRVSSDEKSVHRTKHLSVQASYPREQIENKQIAIEHVKSEDQLADMLTKPLSGPKFVKNRNKLMKPVAMFITLLCFMTIVQGQKYMFNEVSPLIWIPTDYHVETGLQTYKLEITHTSPCDQLPTSANHKNAKPDFSDQEYGMYSQIYRECKNLYDLHWKTRVQELLQVEPEHNSGPLNLINKRKKRNPWLIFYGSVVVIDIVTNLVSALVGYSLPWSDSNRVSKLESQAEIDQRRIKELEDRTNATDIILKKFEERITRLELRVYENTLRINRIAEYMPIIAWTSACLQQTIMDQSSRLDLIINQYKKGKVATFAMSELFNMTDLDEVPYKDTIFESATRLSMNTIQLVIHVRRRAPDTSVYQAYGFSYWDNLTSTPHQMRYEGNNYLIYNKTNNCAKAIETPTAFNMAVQEECHIQDYRDPKLRRWTKFKPTDEPDLRPVHKRIDKYEYIYCWGNNITIEGVDHECPTYPFKLPSSTSFNMTDFYHTAPKDIEVRYHPKWEIIDTSITNSLTPMRQTTNLELINTLMKMKQVAERGYVGESWIDRGLYIIIIGTLLVMFVICCFYLAITKILIQLGVLTGHNKRISAGHKSEQLREKKRRITNSMVEFPDIFEPLDSRQYNEIDTGSAP